MPTLHRFSVSDRYLPILKLISVSVWEVKKVNQCVPIWLYVRFPSSCEWKIKMRSLKCLIRHPEPEPNWIALFCWDPNDFFRQSNPSNTVHSTIHHLLLGRCFTRLQRVSLAAWGFWEQKGRAGCEVWEFDTFRLLWSKGLCIWMIPVLTHCECATQQRSALHHLQPTGAHTHTHTCARTCPHPELVDRLLWQKMWLIMAVTAILSGHIREQRIRCNATHYVTRSGLGKWCDEACSLVSFNMTP